MYCHQSVKKQKLKEYQPFLTHTDVYPHIEEGLFFQQLAYHMVGMWKKLNKKKNNYSDITLFTYELLWNNYRALTSDHLLLYEWV